MQFEMTINMDGRGFEEGSKRRSLANVVATISKEIGSRDFGDVNDWYGNKVGEWRITGKQ